uniref:Zygote arrest 1 n=1 Tax=Equus caballus TaxID=9796 RepID=A0A9L0SKH1_HORSE
MAALGDEGLDGYMYPACAPCSYPIPYLPAAKGKGAAGGADWRHRGGSYPPASSSSSSSSAVAAEPRAGQGAPALPVPRAEVWLLPLQGLQHPVGKCLRVVCTGHEQGLLQAVLQNLSEVLQPLPSGGHHLSKL